MPETPSLLRALALIGSMILGLPAVHAQALPDYVGSGACTACHEKETQAWSGSHHALAWTLPSPETVVADFDNTVFEQNGMTARFRIEGDAYHVGVTETNGVTTDYRVHSVAGIEPLQQYLLETEPGKIQSFDVVWNTEEGGWFHLYPDQDLPPDDGLHWTGPYKNWNARCAECHATGYEKNYSPRTRQYSSVQAEIGVGCEACHGPGAAHLAWADGRGLADGAAELDAYGFTQAFDSTEVTIQQCATCHSRREAHTAVSPWPGTPYHDAYNLALLRPGLYHADGQILDEVYVYGSFLQSKMYAKGVGCLDCHDAHTAELVTLGNAVCTQCHSPAGNPDFPSLKLMAYDTPEHHFHENDTDGAQCISCHAPQKVYMGNDRRADHSFRVPRPDLSAQTGAPDACTSCHTDRDPGWAAAEIEERFPEADNRQEHYGQILARGRENPAAAEADLASLAVDADQPGIVRATALWLLEREARSGSADRVTPLLDDDDPMVRAAAVSVQRLASPQDQVLRVLDLITDPVRSVRIAAAKTLLNAPIARLPRTQQKSLNAAMDTWRASLSSRLDFPETHLQLAGMALTMRAFPQAEAAFRETVTLDPQRAEAWVMLVRIAAATRGAAAARAVLDEARAVLPNEPTLRAIEGELGNN